MKELITRVEELAVQLAGAQLQIDKSEAESRELGREIGRARQKMMELVNERDHALARVPPEAWLEENKKLTERIERMEESTASADMLRKSMNDEITKRDRELREMDAEAKAHREAMQKKDAEIQEWLMQLENARNERDAALREAESLRSQVPLESTREALKNAVAKLQEVTTRADNIATCRDRWMKIAADCGRMDGEDAGEFIARLAQQAAQGVELAVKVEELRVATIKQEQELEELRAAATIAKMGTGEVVKHPHINWQVVATNLQNEIARLNAKVGPLEKLYTTIKNHLDHGIFFSSGAGIYDAVAETAKALSQLTA